MVSRSRLGGAAGDLHTLGKPCLSCWTCWGGHCLSSVLVLRGRGSRVRARVNWVEIRGRSSLPWNDLQLSPYKSILYTVIPFCFNATRRVSFPATPGLEGRGQVYSVTRNFLLSQGIGVGGVQGRFFIGFQEPPNLGWCL